VGFIDDSPYKQEGRIQGLKVLGNFSNLSEVCEHYEVEELLICIMDFPEEKGEVIRAMCAENGIVCKRFAPVFDRMDKDEEAFPEYEISYM
jgi:FlaA1/EpsC-like NDP-sugar epimerase